MSRSRVNHGFTLVELLVVIGIIALLISILLPTLAAARRAANTVACLSNVRQLGLAAVMFAADHKQYVPIASDDKWAKMNDPSHAKWAYRTEPGAPDGSGVVVYDWASSLVPYLGGKVGQTFITAPEKQSKVFRCPADEWIENTSPGYQLFNNVAGGNQPVSYGYNADIACVSNPANGFGVFGLNDRIGVVGGPAPFTGTNNSAGQPLQCKLSSVRRAAEVVIFGDCGTRPGTGGNAPLDYNDALYFTTNYMGNNSGLPPEDLGKLSGIMKTGWLKGRIPMLRHGGKKLSNGDFSSNCKINVAFADGHADSIQYADFAKVRVTPYR